MIISRAKEQARRILGAALASVDPATLIRQRAEELRRKAEGFDRVMVAAFGKAANHMSAELEEVLGQKISDGVVITKYGHSERELRRLEQYEAAHPVPDEAGVEATARLRKMVEGADEKTLVIGLVSGGGSALLVEPAPGITLSDKQDMTELLLKSGVEISELNTVRKHISNVKGGRLAAAAWPATMLNLILSDVIGDRMDVIASGPTVPDESTWREALGVFEKYGLKDTAEAGMVLKLSAGHAETPKSGDRFFERVENRIIGSNRLALEAAAERAESLGLLPRIVTDQLSGEAREVGRRLALEGRLRHGECLIYGGETTVTVRGEGKGGRNTELALAFALAGAKDRVILSAGTDGTDGPTDAAGAFSGPHTGHKALEHHLDPVSALDENDSYNFFKTIGDLEITGPTGTNVMDIQIIIGI